MHITGISSTIGSRSRGRLESLRVLGRGLGLVAGAAPATAIAFVALLAITGLLPVGQVWLSREIVNGLAGDDVAGGTARMLAFAGLYAGTILLPSVFDPLQRALQAWLQDRTIARVDNLLMLAGERLVDLGRLERSDFQDELNLTRQYAWRIAAVFRILMYGIGPALTILGVLYLLWDLNPLLPLALVAASVPYVLAERRVGNKTFESMVKHSGAAREMDYCVRITTEAGAAKELRVFGLGEFFAARFDSLFGRALSEMDSIRLGYMRWSALFGAVHAAALAGGFWYVSTRTASGQLTVGDIALYVNALVQADRNLSMIGRLGNQMHSLAIYLRRFFNLIDTAGPEIRLAPPEKALRAPARIERGIELHDVTFRYPEGDRPVLDEISLELPAGKVTALVGANGAGKSTLVKLVTRMYDPTEGTILLDGKPLESFDLEGLRASTAVVYQDFARFALTLRENVAVGAGAQAACAGIRVEEAARWSGADSVARKLPHGYDTELTRRFEGGVELSGGEWQKVALARGYVRDSALVILDEPTSALDAEAEYALFERFRELVRGRTALIISHRFSTVRMADHIIVLEEGKIIEAGGHAELVRKGGRYAELFEMQAGRYR